MRPEKGNEYIHAWRVTVERVLPKKKVKRQFINSSHYLQGLFLGIQKVGQRKGKLRQHTSESLRECLQKSSGHSPLLVFCLASCPLPCWPPG
jgi:hypothetical protein